ncbi:hypothetical protein [Nocardioides terrisoli]|uniref:hypothetical protein n=1 Tax=Nocardioides terrisoli TaxID=3388267 RepID=UPI00287BB4C8|nr:hypothetical protein [Nocardioides marmorisolisilvae]
MTTQQQQPQDSHQDALRRFLLKPMHSEDRWLGVLALVVTAGTHVPLIREHLEEAPYVGWLFIALTVVSVVLAVLLVVADTPAVWLTAGLTASLALIAFVLSRTVGLPQIGDDIGNWTEPLGFPALAGELIAALVAYVALRPRPSPPEPAR